LITNRVNNEPRQRREVDTPLTDKEIKANALRYAGNTWRRFIAYRKRYAAKYGDTSGTDRSPEAYFQNRLLEDSFAIDGGANPLPHGKKAEPRQNLSDKMLAFRASLEDSSLFDETYAASLSRRMPLGYTVEISKAMSSSPGKREKDSIRTFVSKVK
jgi:hypothetical protein